MKSALITMGAVCVTMVSAVAEYRVPYGVFKVDQLEEAKSQAKEKERPLAFVWMNPGTT
ncbi:hypothetical protein [Persicirhabdus sediminis]|uniref:Uncharacterized protein n=1 Tax=Persicirhabdus sediminis TaxID=454144 RepID=A0A8J7MDT6_9BACT|nr:hypothetical protein [Persicirhabdus sediminis]MBK1791421.1 hypothetical protein [Persicirhabdus sediminis]